MESAMNENLTTKQVNSILQLKFITLKDAIKQPKNLIYTGNLLIVLDVNVNDYIDFLETYGTNQDEMKFKLLLVKLQLAGNTVRRQDGSVIKLGGGDTFDDVLKKLRKNKVYKTRHLQSSMNEETFLKQLIEQNKILP